MHGFSFRRVVYRSRDAKLLADVNPVRILKNVPVGIEYFRIQVAVAIILLGNFPESLALLDFVPLRRVKGIGAAFTFLFACLWAYIGYRPRVGVLLLGHKILLSVWLIAKLFWRIYLVPKAQTKNRQTNLRNAVPCSSLLQAPALRYWYFPDLGIRNPLCDARSLRQVRDLLAAKGGLRHRTPRGPDKHHHTVNELGTHGGAFICDYCGGVGTEVYFISFESVHRRLVLEHNQLAIVLKPGLKPYRRLGQFRVADVLAFLVNDTPTVGSAKDKADLGDLRKESETITLLGKGLKLRIHFIPFLP